MSEWNNDKFHFRLPAEWEPQDGVQLTWPHPDTEWYQLDKVLVCYCAIAAAIQRFEPVFIVARDVDECKRDIANVAAGGGVVPDTSQIRFFSAPINDTWARDHGGISVLGPNGGKYIYDFVFNGWGLKFASDKDNHITRTIASQGAFSNDVRLRNMAPFVLEGGSIDFDGAGSLMATVECLGSDNRNEQFDLREINDRLESFFGLYRVLWLRRGGIVGDDTDSHVDILARFCSPDTIAYTRCDDPEDTNYDELSAMERELRQFRTLDGRPYNLIPLPLPDPLYLDDYRLPASYANFLIVNGGVLMPGCGSRKDEVAAAALAKAFPGREIVTVDCRALLSGHGGLHCVTMNYPKGFLNNEQNT